MFLYFYIHSNLDNPFNWCLHACWQARVRELELENARSRMQMVFVPGMLPDTAYLRLDLADLAIGALQSWPICALPTELVLQTTVTTCVLFLLF